MTSDKSPETPAGMPLDAQIRSQITIQGPMSLAAYMQLCLTHPEYGYYKSADPIGVKGDFVTAPEISQMFGEMLGAWVLMTWQVLGQPDNFTLVELGPGRGTLMADALRMIGQDPKALSALNLTLLETNPVLIAQQREELRQHSPSWITEIAELSATDGPLIVLANEFFDALPMRQFQLQDTNWHERLIGLRDGELAWGLSPTPMPSSTIPAALNRPQEDAIWETSTLAQSTVREISDLLNRHGGGMLAIDYGYANTQTGDTFQAVGDHKFTNPLQSPGRVDLSAHVDFEALINAATATGANAHLAGTQSQLLKELGIAQRAERLIQTNPDRAEAIAADLERLIGKDQMGDLFKAMVVFGAPQNQANKAPQKTPHETAQNLAQLKNIRHGFFGRTGGVSVAPYHSLNVSTSTGDDTASVEQNRRLIEQSLGVAPGHLATVKQVHSSRVITIDANIDLAARPEADGLVTKQVGIALGVLSADCTPILLVDANNGVIGACHAGWRGAIDGILANTVSAMRELGADPAAISAAIGPTIWQQSYEVGEDFVAEIIALHAGAADRFSQPSTDTKPHFDLPGFVRDRLLEAGIKDITQIKACTYRHPDRYYSHRYATHHDTITGRQMSAIALV